MKQNFKETVGLLNLLFCLFLYLFIQNECEFRTERNGEKKVRICLTDVSKGGGGHKTDYSPENLNSV